MSMPSRIVSAEGVARLGVVDRDGQMQGVGIAILDLSEYVHSRRRLV